MKYSRERLREIVDDVGDFVRDERARQAEFMAALLQILYDIGVAIETANTEA